MFLGILLYLKFRMRDKAPIESVLYFLSLLMFAFALMTKETAIIMPALIFISDYFFLSWEDNLSLREKFKRIGKAIWPFMILAGFYIFLRATVLNFKNTFNLYNEENIFTSNFYIRLFTFFRVLTIYFGILFWPLNLHTERSVALATSLNSFSVIFGGILFVGLLALALSQFKRLPILSFGILWFFIGLAPTSNLLVPINGLLYEHWLYLPLVGVFLILIWVVQELGEKYNLQKILLALFVVVLILLSVLTIKRNGDWRDPITFYNQTLRYAPKSYRVINNLGMAYADQRNYDKAIEMYRRAIDLDASNPVAYHNLANAYYGIGEINLAIENYHIAISLDPKFAFSYNALAKLYLENKNYEEARKVLEHYLDYSDSKIDILELLAQIAAEQKDFRAALSYLEKAAAIDPGNQFIQNFIRNVKNLIETQK
jgi:tetratricopeptide (TPR) repeat protein